MRAAGNGAGILAALTILVLAGCAQTMQTKRGETWRLAPATETAGEGHLIVTVALEDAAARRETAERLQTEHPITLVAEWPLSAIDVHCLVFRAADGSDLSVLSRELGNARNVQRVQPVQQFGVLGHGYTDKHVDLQTSLLAINALKAHRLATGAEVRVALVDTGVDAGHPDLAGQVVLVRDFVGDDGHLPSQEAHGTAIAGIIAAEAANGMGIVGVAPDAKLLGLRGCWQQNGRGRCSSFSLARAINFAIEKDADILNLSLAGPYDPLLAELIGVALQRGVIVVAAAGTPALGDFPASQDGVISADTFEAETNWVDGKHATLPAPGSDVITTAPGGGYDFVSGSSVAAAHVSGVAALLLQRTPELTPARIQQVLRESVQTPANGQEAAMLDACLAIAKLEDLDPPLEC